MLSFLIPIITLIIILRIKFKSQDGKMSLGVAVILLYLFSLIFSIPYVFIFDEKHIISVDYLEGSIVFILLLLLYLLPLICYDEKNLKGIKLPSLYFLKMFSWVIVVFSLISIVYFAPISVKALTTYDIKNARIDMVHEGIVLVDKGLLNTIAGTIASFYQFSLLLFFIFLSLGSNRILRLLLFVSSFSYVLFVFSAYGRDGVVFWMFSFIGLYLFFKPFLLKEYYKKIKIIALYFLVIAGTGFMIITFSRFDQNPYNAIISYYGQGFPNFLLAYNSKAPAVLGTSFPLFREIFGFTGQLNTELRTYYLEMGGTYSWVFGTFLKSFINNFGVIGTFVVSIGLLLLSKIIIKNKRIMHFSSLLYYFLLFMVYSQGVFYFRQANRVGNLVIIVSFILIIFFSFYMRFLSKDNIVLYRLENESSN